MSEIDWAAGRHKERGEGRVQFSFFFPSKPKLWRISGRGRQFYTLEKVALLFLVLASSFLRWVSFFPRWLPPSIHHCVCQIAGAFSIISSYYRFSIKTTFCCAAFIWSINILIFFLKWSIFVWILWLIGFWSE